jgi:stress response protein SCP2
VYFGQLTHPSGCVEHHGDNLTGAGDIQEGDDENISVYLKKVPQDRDKIVFVLNIYKSSERHQTLDRVKNLYIRLFDGDTNKTLIEYRVDQNMINATAIVIGAAIRRGGDWNFKAIGKTMKVESVAELASRCASMSL